MYVLTPYQLPAVAVVDTEDEGTIVMLLADLPTQLRFEDDPATARVTSDSLGGTWFGAVRQGEGALAFGLTELARADGVSAVWSLPEPPAEVLAAALGGSHMVAIVPSDVQGAEEFGRDELATMLLLERATIVDISHRAASLAALAEALGDDEHASLEGLVDLADVNAVRIALAPLRSRVALATGELLTDEQILPMAWRPWHYDLVDGDYVGGLLWQWPVIQIFFELVDPEASALDGIAPPSPEQRRLLENYLSTVRRLAGSLAVNSADSIGSRWSPGGAWSIDTINAPHEDALPALLATLRLLLDPAEGSQQSFSHVAKALSTAANAAGLTDLVLEFKRWRKAHQQLLRRHLDDLRHELAEEMSGERLGQARRGPFSGAPGLSPQELLRAFMYGEALHRDAAKQTQIAEWDRDPVRGPTTRMEVRSDAQGFVHFYGAFAGYVARWLDIAAREI